MNFDRVAGIKTTLTVYLQAAALYTKLVIDVYKTILIYEICSILDPYHVMLNRAKNVLLRRYLLDTNRE